MSLSATGSDLRCPCSLLPTGQVPGETLPHPASDVPGSGEL